MKTISLFLLLTMQLSVISQIKTEAYIDAGLTNWANSIYTNVIDVHTVHSKKVSFYSSIVFKASWKRYYLKSDIKTFSYKNPDIYRFRPNLVEWVISTGFVFKRIEFTLEHSCTHPVLSIPYEEITNSMYRAHYNRLYIRFYLKK